MKCDKCNSSWDEEYMSTIRIYEEGKYPLKNVKKDEREICQDCRNTFFKEWIQ